MKSKALKIIGVTAILMTSFIIGRNTVNHAQEIPDTYIDTAEITSVIVGSDGLEMRFDDGTGYYIESEIEEVNRYDEFLPVAADTVNRHYTEKTAY